MKVNERFAKFSRPFILGAKNVYATMLSANLKTQKPIFKTAPLAPQGDLSAVLELNGKIKVDGSEKDFKSLIVFTWPLSTYLKMSGVMLMATYEEFSDEIADVGVEILNIIMTNIKKDLKAMDYTLNPATPFLHKSKESGPLPYPPNLPIVNIPIECEHGPFLMEFCYQEI